MYHQACAIGWHLAGPFFILESMKHDSSSCLKTTVLAVPFLNVILV